MATSAAAAGALGAGGESGKPTPPNVVLFVVDDMGWQDTSVPFWTRHTPFNDRYHTPAMERVANEGMRFTDAHAAPVCTPTRVSLMTGWSPARSHVTNWTLHPDQDTSGKHPTLLPPSWNLAGLSNTRRTPRAFAPPTLPALLRRSGYRTIHCGKAHFGATKTPGADPLNLGFDVNIAGHAAGAPGSYLPQEGYGKYLQKDHAWDVPGLDKYIGTGTFLTEALTIEALRAVDEAISAEKPFFLNMAHYAVHVPFAPDDRFFGKYVKAGLDRTEAMYAALLEGMDKSLGDLMAELRKRGVAHNTLVIFVSDNGGLSAHGRGGLPNTHNAPLKSGKGSAHEGGVRVPMIVRWPGVVKPGTVCGTPVISEDLFGTILSAAGVPGAARVVAKGDGTNLCPLLRGTGAPPADRPLLFNYPHVWGPTGPGIYPFTAVRAGDWKLIFSHAEARCELYNLAVDIGEEHDLSARHPAKLREMQDLLRARIEATGAQLSVDRATGKAVAAPG